MAHANGPTARATVTSTSWWWGQEQRVVLNFGDADTTQTATGATSAQIDFVCIICTSNSSSAAVASFYLLRSLCVSLFKGLTQQYRHFSTCPFIFRSYNEVFVQMAFIPYYLSTDIDFVCVLCTSSSTACCCCLSFFPSISPCLCSRVSHTTISPFLYLSYPFIFS